MSIIMKCKMCGGDLKLVPGSAIATCEYCGTTQTVPSQDDEKKLIQFERAERLRRNCDFDKAAGIYENIVADFRQEAEAYWGLVLCKYGVEYVTDPATSKKIPTCHRSSFGSVMDDPNFELTLENADVEARKLYREEAKALEEIRKGIIEVSSKEAPYDIFICYKETDEKGERTLDSVLAQDIYDALTEKGYRTFFARISLEDKLGQEYEPYIFAALNSAKVMLAIGTDYEYYNAVWVKNEWSRFLQLIASGQKKTLIPCFKGIDAYDMPKEFAKLQAQDLGKVGAMQDLLRGIEKLISTTESTPVVSGMQADDVNNLIIYSGAVEIAKKKTIPFLKKAIQRLQSISDWPDAKIKLAEFEEQLRKLKRRRTIVAISIPTAIVIAVLMVAGFHLMKYNRVYNHAAELEETGLLVEAAIAFSKVDRNEELNVAKDILTYIAPKRLDAKERSKELWDSVAVRSTVSAGNTFSVAIKNTGTIAVCGTISYEDVTSLNANADYVEVSPFDFGFALLRSDGTVSGYQSIVPSWTDIVSIASSPNHIVGLKSDGTVTATGSNNNGECNVSDWSDIVEVAANNGNTFGLKIDGSVVATGKNDNGQCNVSDWTDIIAISAGRYHTVGLRADGTVVAVGLNANGQCDVAEWTDIVEISAGMTHTIGLRSDGTVVAVGDNNFGQCDVKTWSDIVSVSACLHTLGVTKDGTVIATGANIVGQCDVQLWTNIAVDN